MIEIENNTTGWSLRFKRMGRVIQPLLGIGTLLGAVWLLRRQLHQIQLSVIVAEMHRITPFAIVLSVLLTAICYILLTSYDLLAFRYLGVKLSYSRILFAAFIGYSLSNNLSMTPSVAIRYRIYSAWGVPGGAFSRVVIFHMLSTWLGFFTVAGVLCLFEPLPSIPSVSVLSQIGGRNIGMFLLTLLICYLGIARWRRRPLKFWKVEFAIPTFKLTCLQMLAASADWTLTGAVLYVLIPEAGKLGYGRYLMTYLVAQVVAINSHLPGGMGAFEGICLLLLSPYFSLPTLLGALLLYRLIYFLIPLLVGVLLLAIFELDRRGDRGP